METANCSTVDPLWPVFSVILRYVLTICAVSDLRTAGKPVRIALSIDKTMLPFNWDSVAYVNASVVDENGIVVPAAADKIVFAIDGPGLIAAVDNADTTSHESFQAVERSAFQGRCIALVKASRDQGRITVKASAPGLATGSITLDAVK